MAFRDHHFLLGDVSGVETIVNRIRGKRFSPTPNSLSFLKCARPPGRSRYFFTLSKAFWQSSFLVSIFYERRGLLSEQFKDRLTDGCELGNEPAVA